tara:strand:- start:5172 stop:7391 length:2220 start_codon:yes stop_codon:yes gene_type:complete
MANLTQQAFQKQDMARQKSLRDKFRAKKLAEQNKAHEAGRSAPGSVRTWDPKTHGWVTQPFLSSNPQTMDLSADPNKPLNYREGHVGLGVPDIERGFFGGLKGQSPTASRGFGQHLSLPPSPFVRAHIRTQDDEQSLREKNQRNIQYPEVIPAKPTGPRDHISGNPTGPEGSFHNVDPSLFKKPGEYDPQSVLNPNDPYYGPKVPQDEVTGVGGDAITPEGAALHKLLTAAPLGALPPAPDPFNVNTRTDLPPGVNYDSSVEQETLDRLSPSSRSQGLATGLQSLMGGPGTMELLKPQTELEELQSRHRGEPARTTELGRQLQAARHKATEAAMANRATRGVMEGEMADLGKIQFMATKLQRQNPGLSAQEAFELAGGIFTDHRSQGLTKSEQDRLNRDEFNKSVRGQYQDQTDRQKVHAPLLESLAMQEAQAVLSRQASNQDLAKEANKLRRQITLAGVSEEQQDNALSRERQRHEFPMTTREVLKFWVDFTAAMQGGSSAENVANIQAGADDRKTVAQAAAAERESRIAWFIAQEKAAHQWNSQNPDDPYVFKPFPGDTVGAPVSQNDVTEDNFLAQVNAPEQDPSGTQGTAPEQDPSGTQGAPNVPQTGGGGSPSGNGATNYNTRGLLPTHTDPGVTPLPEQTGATAKFAPSMGALMQQLLEAQNGATPPGTPPVGVPQTAVGTIAPPTALPTQKLTVDQWRQMLENHRLANQARPRGSSFDPFAMLPSQIRQQSQ